MMNITYDLPDLGRKDHVHEGIAVFIALMAETQETLFMNYWNYRMTNASSHAFFQRTRRPKD
jgi:hypothetical protein